MNGPSGSSDGTFYFQAWHVAKVISGESWVQNKDLADFVEQNVCPATKNWLHIKGCVPTKEKPGLLVPYSICAKLRNPKAGQDPKDAEQALLHFRNQEFPAIAKTYFTTRLNKSLDFFNSYSEGADFDSPLAKFATVKTSKKLKLKLKSAVKNVKKAGGDLVHGLVDSISPKGEFKAARFIKRRGKDPASDPNLLPTAPLQNPLPLPVTIPPPVQQPKLSVRPRKTSDTSNFTVETAEQSIFDGSSVGSVETTQSSVLIEESSHDVQHAKESSEPPVVLEEEEASTSLVVEEAADSTTDAEVATDTVTSAESSEESTSTAFEETSNTTDAEADTPDAVATTESEGSTHEVFEETADATDAEVDAVDAETTVQTEESAHETLEETNNVEADASDAVTGAEPSEDSTHEAFEETFNTTDAEVDAVDTVDTDTTKSSKASTSSVVEETSTTTTTTSTDTEADIPDATAADSSEASYRETVTEPTDATSAPAIISTSTVVATRRKMNSVSPQATQTAYFVVQDSGNWLRYLMAHHGQSAQQLRSTFFDSPIILATAVSPLEALEPDGMTRVYFMSQARKQLDEVICDEKGRAVRTRRGSKSVREWVVGTARISTHALTMHLGAQLEKRNVRLLPAPPAAVREVDSVVGPNNRLIEMADAPGIPQAILVTTSPVEEVREGDIVQEERDDGFVHIETNMLSKPVEEVVPENTSDSKDVKGKGKGKAVKTERKTRSKNKFPGTKNKASAKTKAKKTAKVDRMTNTMEQERADAPSESAADANYAAPRKPSKVYTPPFSRRSWRDVEPQEPQVIYDVMSGYDFLQVEDVQVFSFSTSSHDMMLRTAPALAVEGGEGIDVWSPPVVGIFSWMWDYLAPGGWSKAAATAH